MKIEVVSYAVIITLLHTGAMGSAVAASVARAGHDVCYVPSGRSSASTDRASRLSLRPVTLEVATAESDIILSVCPPHAAESVAHSVGERGFAGVFVDANAVSPARVQRIADITIAGGATFVDGGIVGGPPSERHQTYLYLSGKKAEFVAACFSEGLIESQIVSDRIGDASALKMCYAAYTKGSTAMLLAITAAAENLGVRDVLFAQWKREGSGLDESALRRGPFVTQKAWRWIDEMEEIATTFRDANMPDGFHRAAAELYTRIEHLRPADDSMPDFEAVLNALRSSTTHQ